MMNLLKQLKKSGRKKTNQEIGLMLKLIRQKSPELSTPQELSLQIMKDFGEDISAEDIIEYDNLHIKFENHELESKKHQYGIIY